MPLFVFDNPFRPGAGHRPPYLAGRSYEQDEMRRLLQQRVITQNAIVTGLRGVGKTVLLETFKPLALSEGWLWATADLSESASVSESTLATRILADIALVTAPLVAREIRQFEFGFNNEEKLIRQPLNFEVLQQVYNGTSGLVSDKLRTVLEFVWGLLPKGAVRGIVFAYDEAQNLSDHAENFQYPLSILLEVFQSIQRKDIPFMLVLTGLPTLAVRLVEARTYSERMFHTMFLKPLDEVASMEAITKPVEDAKSPVKFTDEAAQSISKLSAGYPYFIQFICKEVFDTWITKVAKGEQLPPIPVSDIIRKLDADFFHGRWMRATDRQRELLQVVSTLENCDAEFTVQEVTRESKKILAKPFTSSHVSQMLSDLAELGLIYKNRFAKYSLAVPLLGGYIRRQTLSGVGLPITR